ncbi:TRAP transporter small permease [Melaminivora sp.]|uniref:TRAP transporter small permease n=1 Tax=Melaminivora sp. TaxID=1933032 RepID=UPI0028B0FA03|nr:TRAP transporter small permease [Melaminivora sp.]
MPSPSPSRPADAARAAAPTRAADAQPRSLRLEDWLTVLSMALLALITFANVVVRYFTNSSFAWTEELSIFLMIVLSLVGGASAVARDQHIRIEFFCQAGPAGRRRRLAQLGALLVALLFLLIAVLSVRVVWDDYRFEETSPGIGVPQWWYSIWLPVLSLLIAARAVGLYLRRTRQSDAQYLAADAPPPAAERQP